MYRVCNFQREKIDKKIMVNIVYPREPTTLKTNQSQ
jgi:hypothetical protein